MDGCFRIFSRYELKWGILNLIFFIDVEGNNLKLKVVWKYYIKYFYLNNLLKCIKMSVVDGYMYICICFVWFE